MSWSRTPELERNFNAAYLRSLPPVLRDAIDSTPFDEAERMRVFSEHAPGYGVPIDVPLHIWRWDPFTVMVARFTAGYTWVPAAGMQPVAVPPGIDFPGSRAYDPDNPPPGSIKVVNPMDRSTWPDPWPEEPTVPTHSDDDMVGRQYGNGTASVNPSAWGLPHGARRAEDGHTWELRITWGFAGPYRLWHVVPDPAS